MSDQSKVSFLHTLFHPRAYFRAKRPDSTNETLELKAENNTGTSPQSEPVLLKPANEEPVQRKERSGTYRDLSIAGLGGVGGSLLAFGLLGLFGEGSVSTKNHWQYPTQPKTPPGFLLMPQGELVQGYKENSLTPNELEKRDKELANALKSSSPAINSLSKHLNTLSNYAKPAVVYIKAGNNPYTEGKGSGFIYSSDGVIVTNFHVISNQYFDFNQSFSPVLSPITVKLYDGREVKARVLGFDETTDLAALKIDLNNLPTLKLGTKEPQTGDFVMAIGHPPNLAWSTTFGILSSSDRVNPGTNKKYLQTDAPISHGNSGGPLLNMEGEVVGVNNMIVFGPGLQNLGLSVSSSVIEETLPKLIN